MLKSVIKTVSGDASAGVPLNLKVDWGGITPIAYGIMRVAGTSNTHSITFCEFTTANNVRVLDPRGQTVTVIVFALYC